MRGINKIRFLFFASLLTTGILNGQEIDEQLLNSLSLDAKNRLELSNEISQDEDLKTLLSAKSSLKKNEALLSYLSRQVELLKASISSEDQDKSGKLKRFGDEFFDEFQSTFMPVNVANLGAEYVVDVGDELVINLYGKSTTQETVIVNRDGSIAIPSVGKLVVAGKTFQKLEELFNSYLESNVLGVQGTISLSKVRDIQVLALGYAYKPGIYTVAGGSSIIGALKAAGGISENGSYRNISHFRNGILIWTYDLYDLLIKGIFDETSLLRSGDAILVNPIEMSIPISGGVNRPAVYEILDDENINDLIYFAGGISDASDGYGYIYINNYNSSGFEQNKINLTSIKNHKLQIRDQVVVPFFLEEIISAKEITIKGWVKKPGKYFLQEDETYAQLLSRAGGYKDGAYQYGISLFRKDAIDRQLEYTSIEYSKSLNYLVSSLARPGISIPSNALEFLKEDTKAKQTFGRIINDFRNNDDLILMDGDEIVVPRLQNVIYLFGEFNKTINAKYDPAHRVSDYIKIGGGLSKNATDQLVIIDPDGSAKIYKISRLSNLISSNDIDIYPGSIIYAPRDIGTLSGIQYASTVAPILSSLALSLASLNSINN